MQALHHWRYVFADAQVAYRVVMVVEQTGHPRHEAELSRVVVKSIPEDAFSCFSCECGTFVAAASSNEINLVVDVPVFEPVLIA